MNPSDRDKFYSSKTDDEDDDGEYELEPPDADVIAGEERRGKEVIESSRTMIDIDDIYRDAGRQRSDEILESWVRNFKFRFQTKHLLVATAVLAILLTLYKLELLGTGIVLFAMFSVAGLYFYLQWQEKKAEAEATRRREELYARRRAEMQNKLGTSGAKTAGGIAADTLAAGNALSNNAGDTWDAATPREGFRFRFSVAELMIAMTTAAVVFGLVRILGGPSNTATVLGFVALIGLVAHATGFEPPGIIVLGWWFILVLYVCLSILAAVFPALA